jgi:hypothetical protein
MAMMARGNWSNAKDIAMIVVFVFVGGMCGVSTRTGWERAEARSQRDEP